MPKKTSSFKRATAPSQDAKLRALLEPKNDEDLRHSLWALAYLIDPQIGTSLWGTDPKDALIEYGLERYGVTRDSF